MQICDNGVIREMTEAEEYTANNLPDPADQVSDTELLNILMGGAE